MIETDRLAAYLAACSILALTPGPGILYVTTRTIAGGSREGVLSARAFQALKYAVAAYLYLGIPMIRRSRHLEVADAPQPKANPFAQFVVLGARPPRPKTNRHLVPPPTTRHRHGNSGNLCRG